MQMNKKDEQKDLNKSTINSLTNGLGSDSLEAPPNE